MTPTLSPRRIDIKAILADAALRRRLMTMVIVATQAAAGIETSEVQAIAAYNRVRSEVTAS